MFPYVVFIEPCLLLAIEGKVGHYWVCYKRCSVAIMGVVAIATSVAVSCR